MKIDFEERKMMDLTRLDEVCIVLFKGFVGESE